MNIALWVVQALLSLTFIGTGIWKLATPIADLGAAFPWMGEVSPAFLSFTAVLAALGCVALQGSAVVFHLSRGEAANTPFNILLIALAVFVAWGRRK